MKKVFILMVALLLPMLASAYDAYIDGVYYNINSSTKTAEVVYGNFSSGDVIIPSQVTYEGVNYIVASIGFSAFRGCSGLTSITIPNTITYIGEDSFRDCNGISIYITDLEAWCEISFHPTAFSSFDGRDWNNYYHRLFLNGKEIKDLVIPSRVTSISQYAFSNCTSFTSVTIPQSVTSIGSGAFRNCCNLTSIVSEIKNPFDVNDVFGSDISSTATLTVPAGTNALYQSTAGWNKFQNIVEASEGGEIGQVFESGGIYYEISENNTVSVTKGNTEYSGDIVIPGQVIYNGEQYNVNNIGFKAFYDCSGLTSIVIPHGIKTISYLAFSGCGGLKSVEIANSVEAIGPFAFELCTSLRSIVLPNNVSSIGESAFWSCKSLSSITIPNSVTSIGSSAFSGTAWLLNQSDGLIYAGNVMYCYRGEMSANTSIILKDGTLGIAGSAFKSCSGLTSITIPNSVTSIGSEAFVGCSGLTSIVSEITNPFEISDGVLNSDIYSTATLTVPAGTKPLYQSTEGWNKFKNIVEESTDEANFTLNGVTYQGIKSTKTVVVKSVEKGLMSVEIPATVSYEGTDYQVSGISDGIFNGTNMGALIWNVEATLSNNVFSDASFGSNFLLYVKSASYAPSTMKNVVVNGTASSVLLSDDGGQFYCPQAFTARSISYTHNYSMETGGNGKGWETLALPFDVQKITHSTRGEIVPFPAYNSSSNQKPFWLANFSGSGFRRTSAVLANEPYIIAMPNSSKYRNEYNLAGDVTFSSENVQVPKTPSFSGSFLPAYATMAKTAKVYVLNVNNRFVKYSGSYDAGSCFISGLREVRPFEAYIYDSSTRGVIEINFDDGMTDMDDILLSADEDREINIYTLSGQQVARIAQRDFNQVWTDLPKGVYIVNGMKRIK